MKAKDTVMSPVEILEIVKAVDPEWQGYTVDYAIHESIAEAQAEISFKAGMKEVVGWLRENGFLFPGHTRWDADKLQAKLKEWGVK